MCNLVLIGQVVSEKKLFKNKRHIHVYSPVAGADNPLGSNYTGPKCLLLHTRFQGYRLFSYGEEDL